MPKRRPELPDNLLGPLVTQAEAEAAGLTRRQLHGTGLQHVHRKLWAFPDSAASLESRCAAALRVLPVGSAISHRTAAVLLKVPLPDDEPTRAGDGAEGEAPRLEPIHVSVLGGHPRIRGLQVHRVTAPLPTTRTRSGLVVTSGARTWFDLAGVLGRDDLVVAGDVILRRRLAKPAELNSIVKAYAGRRGARTAAVAVVLLNGRSRSPMETRVRLLLGDHGITGFLVNVAIYDADGGWLAEPDFHFPGLFVVIEYEGEHHTDPKQVRKDIRRYEVLREHGWLVIRLVSTDVQRTPLLTVERIRKALDERAAALIRP